MSDAPNLFSNDRLVRMPELKQIIGYSQQSIYAKMLRGEFPRPLKLGRAVAWPLSQIQAWLESCIATGEQQRAQASSATRSIKGK